MLAAPGSAASAKRDESQMVNLTARSIGDEVQQHFFRLSSIYILIYFANHQQPILRAEPGKRGQVGGDMVYLCLH